MVTKRISTSCGDIAFNDHDTIEFYVEGGGAFSSLSVAGLGGVLCYVASGAAAIPTAGVSGAFAAGACSVVTGAIDAAIDVDAIPNNAEISAALWDYDEEYPFNANTSPTIAVGINGGYGVHWDEMPQVGEHDINLHLGLPQ